MRTASAMEIAVPCKCSQCNKVVETTAARRIVSKTIPVTDQKRRNYLKSDYEVKHEVVDGLYCEWCGHTGGEDDFQKVEPEERTELEEQAFDKNAHYTNWLQWVQTIKDMVAKENGETPNVRKQTPENT